MISHVIKVYPLPERNYQDAIRCNVTVDGVPFTGNVLMVGKGKAIYHFGSSVNNGRFVATFLSQHQSNSEQSLLIFKEGRIYSSELVRPDNVTVYDLAISTTGGGGEPTGDPATISGKVERVLDNQAEPAARQLVAVEHKPDGSWAVIGDTISDADTGSYILDVLTEGGDAFVLAMDDYGEPFTATATVVQGDLIHPTVANGHVYRVEAGGTLPATEPTWWIDTGTNHTRTIEGGVTLRAIAFYRPLAHGPVKAELLP